MSATAAKTRNETVVREALKKLLNYQMLPTDFDFNACNGTGDDLRTLNEQLELDPIQFDQMLPQLRQNNTVLDSIVRELQGQKKEAPVDHGFPELPPNVKANEALASQASPTLDALIQFFQYWCTRSYEGYHEAVAIWVLATIAARRIVLKWRNGMWTTLYVMLVSISGRHAKTEAASYGAKVIRDCGLGYLLVPDETTPQRLLSKMSGRSIPRNYQDMDPEQKEKQRLKFAFSAQKGWLYDEFGDFLQEVIKGKGSNSHFYRLLKQLYDNKTEFTYDTLTRGEEEIQLPSLSVIGTTAPDSLKSIAGRESSVWTDGAFARIAFIVPPVDSLRLQSAPEGEAILPEHIKHTLLEWHNRLGIPDCEIIDLQEREELLKQALGEGDKKKRNDGPQYRVDRDGLPQNEISWRGSGVREAYDLYFNTLVQIGIECKLDARLNSNYIRFPDMALKIAMLLASLENNGRLSMCHWARGQEISERWRRDLHELLAQLSVEGSGGMGEIEDKVLEVITTKLDGKKANSYDITRLGGTLLRQVGSTAVRKICDEFASTGLIEKDGHGRGALYGVKEVTK